MHRVAERPEIAVTCPNFCSLSQITWGSFTLAGRRCISSVETAAEESLLSNTGQVSTTTPATGRQPVPAQRSLSGILTWIPLLALAMLMVRFTSTAAGPIKDPDAWWHLRVGGEFWSGDWSLRHTGPLSSFATEQWTPRDWIPQLIASKMEDWFGLPGVAWLYGAALMAFLICGYFACRRFADPLAACLAVTITAIAASGSLSQRPQMASFIFMFAAASAWLFSSRDLKPRWWLVPLTWVWASSHGMWYCGVAVGVVTVLGVTMDRRANRRQVRELAAIPLLSLAAAACTPIGPTLLLTVFDTTGMWQFVTEWQPPSFTEAASATAVLMIFIVIVTWARGEKSVPWTHICLVTIAVAWILLSGRTVGVGAIVLAPLVADSLQALTAQGTKTSIRRAEAIFIGGVVTSCLVGLGLAVPNTAAAPGNVPSGLNDELDRVPAGSPILNEYALGGWLHWRHPKLQTVVDGFTDGYTAQAVADYLNAASVASGWDDYVEGTRAQVAILRSGSPLGVALADRLQWTVVAEDSGYILLEMEN